MEETVNLSALFVKREDDNGNREEGNVKREDDTAQANSDPCPLLWSGTILLHRERATSLTVAVKIFHQDDSKNTNENCFDWPAGILSYTLVPTMILPECFLQVVCHQLQ